MSDSLRCPNCLFFVPRQRVRGGAKRLGLRFFSVLEVECRPLFLFLAVVLCVFAFPQNRLVEVWVKSTLLDSLEPGRRKKNWFPGNCIRKLNVGEEVCVGGVCKWLCLSPGCVGRRCGLSRRAARLFSNESGSVPRVFCEPGGVRDCRTPRGV